MASAESMDPRRATKSHFCILSTAVEFRLKRSKTLFQETPNFMDILSELVYRLWNRFKSNQLVRTGFIFIVAVDTDGRTLRECANVHLQHETIVQLTKLSLRPIGTWRYNMDNVHNFIDNPQCTKTIDCIHIQREFQVCENYNLSSVHDISHNQM